MPVKEFSEYRNDPRFELLKARALAHWQEHRPKLTRQLKKEGKLDERLDQLVSQALLATDQLKENRNLHADQIREIVLQEYILLPEE